MVLQDTVLNLSEYPIPEEVKPLFEKGLKFCSKPTLLVEGFACTIEKSLIWISDENTRTEVREKCLNIINKQILFSKKRNNKVKYKDHIKVFKEFLERNGLWCVKSDKGNKYVIVSREHYRTGILNIIREGPFEIVNRNPINKISKCINETIQKCLLFTQEEKEK